MSRIQKIQQIHGENRKWLLIYLSIFCCRFCFLLFIFPLLFNFVTRQTLELRERKVLILFYAADVLHQHAVLKWEFLLLPLCRVYLLRILCAIPFHSTYFSFVWFLCLFIRWIFFCFICFADLQKENTNMGISRQHLQNSFHGYSNYWQLLSIGLIYVFNKSLLFNRLASIAFIYNKHYVVVS